ncbi:MAG: hypothetical protein WB664_01000 [Nitrososphaeraceae archaeon]
MEKNVTDDKDAAVFVVVMPPNNNISSIGNLLKTRNEKSEYHNCTVIHYFNGNIAPISFGF